MSEATAVKVKPWWQSVSLWMTVLTAIGIIFDKLVADGVIPNEGWAMIVASVIGLVTKRGMTENAAIKANAIAGAVANPTPPSE